MGEPSVVTNESVANWFTDRWQAGDSQNYPLPGEHWLEVDLLRPCLVTKVYLYKLFIQQ